MATGFVGFEHVSKRYRLGVLGSLRDTVSVLLSRASAGENEQRVLWALRDVTFQVEPGDSLALIGPNGSGKTTTLRLLSNISRPTVGQINVGGRVAALIELGAGFHPELTGRENIYLNGAILGLNRREIGRKLDEIIAFSGLERFIDTPVKRYSSGMYVRLGFAVAAHVEADVLLVDEVLAVGDAEFRRKCIERMEDLRNSGTTVVFVSHNMYQVRRLCNRALLLVKGEPRFCGPVEEAVSVYEQVVRSSAEHESRSGAMGIESGANTITISALSLLDYSGQPVSRVAYDQPLEVRIAYSAQEPVTDPVLRVRLIHSNGTVCGMAASAYQPSSRWTLDQQGTIVVRFEPIQLAAGRYRVDMRILDSMDSMVLTSGQSEWFDVNDPAFGHEVHRGVFVPNLRWSHVPGVAEPSVAQGHTAC